MELIKWLLFKFEFKICQFKILIGSRRDQTKNELKFDPPTYLMTNLLSTKLARIWLWSLLEILAVLR